MQINHAEYQEKVKKLPMTSLLFIIKDCQETLALNPHCGKAGYYADEINYCASEIKRRRDGK